MSDFDILSGKPEKESRQRQRALVAAQLRMENPAVLAGDIANAACIATDKQSPCFGSGMRVT